MKDLIRALRCSARNGSHDACSKCKYRILEEVKGYIPVSHVLEMQGKKYWESCNCDQIALDAADALEKLTEDDLK